MERLLVWILIHSSLQTLQTYWPLRLQLFFSSHQTSTNSPWETFLRQNLLVTSSSVTPMFGFIKASSGLLSSLRTPLASNWQTWHLILVVWLLQKTTSSLLCKFCSLSRLWGFRSFVLCQWLSSTAQSLTYCVYHLNGNHLIPLRWPCCTHSEQCSMNPATFHTFYSLRWQRWQTSLSLRLVIGLPS